MSYQQHSNIPGFYCNPEVKPEQSEEYLEQTKEDILNTLARYFISIRQPPQKVNAQYVYKMLSSLLSLTWDRNDRHLFLKAAATYIEQHQHHQFNLKDYRSQILKHTKQLIEEQKFKRE